MQPPLVSSPGIPAHTHARSTFTRARTQAHMRTHSRAAHKDPPSPPTHPPTPLFRVCDHVMRLMCDSCMHAVSVPLLRFLQPRRPVCLLLAAFQTNGHLPKYSGFFSPAHFHIDKHVKAATFSPKGTRGSRREKNAHISSRSFLPSLGLREGNSTLSSRLSRHSGPKGRCGYKCLAPPHPPTPHRHFPPLNSHPPHPHHHPSYVHY